MSFRDLVADMDAAAQQQLAGDEVITYTPQGGSPVPVVGIYDEQYVIAKGDAEAGVEAGVPAVFFRLSVLPADPMTDKPTITIDGVAFRVIERQPDGMGGIVLALRRVT